MDIKNLKDLPNKKALLAWFLYDWAGSAFPTIVITFVFPAYFTEKIASNKILGTELWGNAMGLAALMIALLSPLLGAIADFEGRRKPWILILTTTAVIAAAALWWAIPTPNAIWWTLFWIILSTVALETSMVFYNAMLDDLAPIEYLGRLSGWSWGFGYFGGLISLSIALFIFTHDHLPWLPLNHSQYEQVRICGPLVAGWFGLFSLPLFFYTPDRKKTGLGFHQALVMGLKSLMQTLRTIGRYKEIFKFLLARMFYIDSLNTIFAFGGVYAAGTMGFSLSEVIQFGIAMNVAAGLGAIVFAWLDDFKGSKITILLALILMIFATCCILFVSLKSWFWFWGMAISLCVGPIQAASRSLMIRLAPKEIITELFGLYAFSGKATAFIGPWLFSLLTALTNSQRVGMISVIIFAVIGFALLSLVKFKENP